VAQQKAVLDRKFPELALPAILSSDYEEKVNRGQKNFPGNTPGNVKKHDLLRPAFDTAGASPTPFDPSAGRTSRT
jgi:hypothetical protein